MYHDAGALHWNVINVWDGMLGYFGLENEGNVVMEDRDKVSPSHRESHEPLRTKRGLEGREIMQTFCDQTLIVSDIEV